MFGVREGAENVLAPDASAAETGVADACILVLGGTNSKAKR